MVYLKKLYMTGQLYNFLPQDFMIGDWMQVTIQVDDTEEGPVFETFTRRVSDLGKHPNGVYLEGDPNAFGEINPIQLTHEILEDIGYKYNYLWYEKKGWPTIEIGFDKDVYNVGEAGFEGKGDPYFRTYFKIKYVHELQHALKLLNIKEDFMLH